MKTVYMRTGRRDDLKSAAIGAGLGLAAILAIKPFCALLIWSGRAMGAH